MRDPNTKEFIFGLDCNFCTVCLWFEKKFFIKISLDFYSKTKTKTETIDLIVVYEFEKPNHF